MNKHFYRIIFNKARGMLMVVAEIVKSHQGAGRSSQKAKSTDNYSALVSLKQITFMTYISLGMVSITGVSYANTIIVDKNADKNQKPTIMQTANGATQVNIVAPSNAGVSHNKFSQFDVSQKGIILNNSHQVSQTELAGYIKGNDLLLKSGSAKVILNEINSKHASQLNGYIEVAGQKAQVIIANAAGITCNGCGFINANRATLTTGKPILENGQLKGYLVEKGNIAINGKGLDTSKQNYTDLIAQTVNINASLWADDVKVIAGRNKVNHDVSQITKLTDTDNDQVPPQLAIDVAVLGGMYAGKIQLVGTEKGVGVHNAGNLGANAGSIKISADGKIVNQGSLQSKSDIILSSSQDILNNKQIYSKQNIKLTTQKQITNHGSVIAQNSVNLNANKIESSHNSIIAAGIDDSGKLSQQGSITVDAKNIMLQGKNIAKDKLLILAEAAINLDNSQNIANEVTLKGDNVSIQHASLKTQKKLELDSSITNISNSIINVKDGINIKSTRLISNSSYLSSEDEISLKANEIFNIDSKIETNNNITINAQELTSYDAQLSAKNDIFLSAKNIDADRANIISENNLNINAENLSTSEGNLQTKKSLNINASKSYLADKVTVIADDNISIFSQTISSNESQISTLGDIIIDSDSLDNKSSTWLADKKISIDSTDIDNGESTFKATGPIEIKFSILNNRNANLISLNSLSLFGLTLNNQSSVLKANSGVTIATDNFNNEKSKLVTDHVLSISADNINNSESQWQAGSINTVITNKFDNNNAKIIAKNSISIKTDDLNNHSTQLKAIDGITITSNHVDNEAATIVSHGDLIITTDSMINKQAELSAKGNINLLGKSIDNTNANLITEKSLVLESDLLNANNTVIEAKDDIDVKIQKRLTGRNSTWISGNDISIEAEKIDAGDSQLGAKGSILISSQDLSLDKTVILSEDRITIDSNNVLADYLQLKAGNQVQINAQDKVSIEHSKMSTNGSLQLNSANIESSSSNIYVQKIFNLTSQNLNNRNSTWLSDNNISINASNIDNQNSIIQAHNDININSSQLNNSQSLLMSGGLVKIQSNTFDNNQAKITSGGPIDINASYINNLKGVLVADESINLVSTVLDNEQAVLSAKGDISLNVEKINSDNANFISEKSLNIKSDDISFKYAELATKGNINVSSENINFTHANIISQQNININTSNINSTFSQLTGLGHIDLKTKNLINTSAIWLAGKTINIDAHNINNNQTTLKSDGSILIKAIQVLDNVKTIMMSDGQIVLEANLLDNSSSQQTAEQSIIINSNQVDNSNTIFISKNNITVTAENINNQNSQIQADKNILFNIKNQLNNVSSKILSGNDTTINTQILNNKSGIIKTGGKLELISNNVNNQDGLMLANSIIKIHATEFLDNRQGRLSSQSDIKIESDTIDNSESVIITEKSLDISSNNLNNQQSQFKAKGDITIQAESFSNKKTSIFAGNNIYLNSKDEIDNLSSELTAGGLVDINAKNNLNNYLAKILSNKGITINAGKLNNKQADLKTNSLLSIRTGELDNSQAKLLADNIDIAATNIFNHLAHITAYGDLNIDIQSLNNNNANLLANNIKINAVELSGDGKINAKNDLKLVLANTFVNKNELAVNNHLEITSNADIYNENKITAGNKITLKSHSLFNNENAEISATSLDLINDSFSNQGLIDGSNVYIKSVNFENLGIGKIYADQLSIQTTILNNLAYDNVAPIIAARNELNIGVETLNNKGHAQILSLGDLSIGGKLDEYGHAIEAAQVINNHSSVIESHNDLLINSNEINNINDHIETEEQKYGEEDSIVYFRPRGWSDDVKLLTDELEFSVKRLTAYTCGSDRDKTCYRYKYQYLPWEELTDKEKNQSDFNFIKIKATGEKFKYFYHYDYKKQKYNTVIVESDPGRIVAAHNITINGQQLNNQDSKIVAGNNLIINANLNNQSVESQYKTVSKGSSFYHWHTYEGGWNGDGDEYHTRWSAYNPADEVMSGEFVNKNILDQQIIDNSALQSEERAVVEINHENDKNTLVSSVNKGVNEVEKQLNLESTLTNKDTSDISTDYKGPNLDTNEIDTKTTTYQENDTVEVKKPEINHELNNIDEMNINDVDNNDLQINTSEKSAKDNRADNVVTISTIELNIIIPDSSLYIIKKDVDKNYIIETDPRFVNKNKWLSSDYMIAQLKADPNNLLKRLGDGYYEQQLIREQITTLTGQRYLRDYSSDIEQYQSLMNAGVSFAKTYGLSIGVELSAAQMDKLTTDIVWLVSKTIVVNGQSIDVLVPQVYIVNRPNLSTTGALTSGNKVIIDGQDITNSGLIVAKDKIQVNTTELNHQGSMFSDSIVIEATDTISSSGKLIAGNMISLSADNNINLSSTIHTETSKNGQDINKTTVIDRVSTIQSAKDIKIVAGRDVNLDAALLINKSDSGLTSITAGHNINLSTLETQNKLALNFGKNHHYKTDNENVVGSEIISLGNIELKANNDVSARAVKIDSNKSISINANNDINITSDEERFQLDEFHYSAQKGLLSNKSKTTIHLQDDTQQKGSSLSGDNVEINAGNDLSVSGSQIIGVNDVNLEAANNVSVNATEQSHYSYQQTITKKSGLMGSGGLGFTIGKENSDLKQTDTEHAYQGSTIGSTEANVNISAGKDINVTGSDIIAKKDINLTGDNVTIDFNDAQTTYKEEYKYEKSGLTVAITGTAAEIYDAIQAMERAKEKGNDKLLALQSIKSGLTGVQAMQDLVLKNKEGQTEASIGVSLMAGTQKTEREVNQEQHSVIGSGVSAGQNITITATGNAQKEDGDITLKGSEVRAGNDITLDANRDLNVIGAVNTQHSDSDEKSYGGAVGIQFQIGGDESGFRVKGNANFSRERENADGSAWSESVINAGNTLTTKTGNDTTIIGGQVNGDTIKMDVGNNLNIQSLQDTDNYDYDKISASVSGSGGSGFSANLALSKTDIESNWASVTDQSGIFAGKGGFDITVGNNTDLQGAVIASSAEDKTHNQLDTGTISFSNIENKADFDVSSMSMSIGTSGGPSPTAGMPTIYHNSGHDHSTTASAVEDGSLTVRNQDEQQQNINQLSRDTANANNPLAQLFNKQKELDKIEAIELVRDIAAQAKSIANKYDRIQAQNDVDKNGIDKDSKDEARKTLGPDATEQQVNSLAYSYAVDKQVINNQKTDNPDNKNIGGMGSSLSKGIDAATSIVTGLITGDITGGLAGASAPYLAEQIKLATGHEDPKTGEWKTDDKAANLTAHALLGAAIAIAQGNSALAGGAGALAGEAAADFIREKLYNKDVKDLSEAEKENISALAQLAVGLAVAAGTGGNTSDIGTAVAGSKNAVENNRLATVAEQKRIDELSGNDPREKLFYQAAACALIKCSAEFAEDDPQKELYQQMEALGNSEALQSYKDELAEQYKTNIAQVSTYLTGGSTVTYETVEKLFEYTSGDQFVDSAAYINNEYSVKTRLGGVLQLGLALTEGVGGIALIPTCETGIGCIASGAMIWHAADTGGTALSVIIDGKQYTAKTAKSLSNLLNISERDAEMLFDLSGMAASLKSTSSLFKNSVANTSKLSAKEIEQIKNNLPTTINKNTRLTEDKIKEILATEKNNRPDPSTYMSKAEIEAHLAKFDDGAVRFTSKAKYDEYGTYGSKDGFVMPKSEFENVMIQSKGDLRIVEQKLGLEKGYLSNSDTLIVYVEKENISSLKIPSGNEAGANQYWLPGGKTSGGISEAIMDFSQKPKVDIIDLETIKKQLSGN